MEPFALAILFILFVAFCYYHWSRRKFYKFAMKMQGPPTLPLIGNLHYFTSSSEDFANLLLWVTNTFNKPNIPKRAWIGPALMLFIDTPDELDVILNHPGALRKSKLYRFIKKMLGDGLVTIDDTTQWKHNRKLLSKNFNQKYLNSFIDIFVKHSEIFIKRLEEFDGKGEFDVFKYAHHLTIDILCETVLGYELNQQNSKEDTDFLVIFNGFCEIFMRVFQPWLYLDVIYNNTKKGKYVNECIQKVEEFAQNIISDKRKEYLKKKTQAEYDDGRSLKSMIDVMFNVLPNEEHLSNKQMLSEIVTFMSAGSDSTAITISFVLMMLGMHQDVQDKVYEELQEIFGNSDRPVTLEDLPHMKYLEQTIKETTRLFPLSLVIARHACEDIKTKSYVIPKGTDIAIAIYCLHRNPMVWKDPLKFDPDRFSPENFSKMNPYAYMSFSAGPRNCIGHRFAMMALKCELATVIRKYKLFCKYKNVADIRVKCDLTTRAVEGNLIRLEKRHK